MIALTGGVVLVIVIALIAVFTRGAPAQVDAGTPEGVVQRYAQAVVDDDVPTALSYVVPRIADTCDRIPLGAEDRRLTLVETTERGESAKVRVLVTTTYGSGPFGGGQYENEEVFELVQEDGDWLIEVAPWQLAVCAGLGL